MRKLKLNVGWIIVISISVIPIILWFLTPRPNFVFGSFQNIITSSGEIFGLVGLVMFSLNFVLAARLFFIEQLFNGLNNVYQKHDLLGQTAFILLLFHPLLLIPRYSTNLKEAASFLFFSSSWARNLGIIALRIMLNLIILAIYLRPKFNLWKITHKFFGLALFFGALHAYFIPTYVMNNLFLKTYVLFFAALGIAAFSYKSILGKFLIKTRKYIVEGVSQLNDDIFEIALRPLENRLTFNSGQFVFISFSQEGISSESHPFSISSGPNENLLRITVKKLGDYTKKLAGTLRKGTVARIEGPHGVFSYSDYQNKNQVWIAGGVGITPFVSFIKDLKKERNYSIALFYCVNNEKEAVYLDLFREMEASSNNFSIILFSAEENGYISAEYIQRRIKNIDKKDIFICAPPKMIKELKRGLITNGINKNNIHSEEFNF